MGSIQALRSEALALRAKEDTNLQVTDHLGKVNKGLGSQITQMIDGLQGVIGERTKAYNGLVTKLNQSINGKGGAGDQAVGWAFKAVKTFIAFMSSVITAISSAIAATAASADAGTALAKFTTSTAQYTLSTTTPPYIPDMEKYSAATAASALSSEKSNQATAASGASASAAFEAAALMLDLMAVSAEGYAISESLNSAIADYEKMVSQLGYTNFDDLDDPQTDPNDPPPDTNDPDKTEIGAGGMIRMRDSIMPRYKPHDSYWGTNRGYIGTLRRI